MNEFGLHSNPKLALLVYSLCITCVSIVYCLSIWGFTTDTPVIYKLSTIDLQISQAQRMYIGMNTGWNQLFWNRGFPFYKKGQALLTEGLYLDSLGSSGKPVEIDLIYRTEGWKDWLSALAERIDRLTVDQVIF